MMKEEEKLYTKELYDLSHTAAAPLLEGTTYPWEALPQIGAFIRELGAGLSLEEYDHPQEDVWIHKTAKIYPNNFIAGPCVIGAGTEVRPGAFIRGNALVGENCVVGNSTELKNVILFDNVQGCHLQREAGQDPRGGPRGLPPAGDRPEEVRRHAGRPRGGGLQQRVEPRHRGGAGLPCVPPVHDAGLFAQRDDSQKQRGDSPPAGAAVSPLGNERFLGKGMNPWT